MSGPRQGQGGDDQVKISVVHEPSGLEPDSSLLATGLLAALGVSNRGLRADSTLDSSLLAVSWRLEPAREQH